MNSGFILPAFAVVILTVASGSVAGLPQVPEGFEELAQGQDIWAEVSLYGQSLGLHQVKVNPASIVFLQPGALISAVKKQYNPALALTALLSTSLAYPLARNGHLACHAVAEAGCGFTETDSVAVIYDENRTRISLFLQKQYLPEENPDDRFHHVTPESRRALIHQQTINLVADRKYLSAAIQGNGSLGITENSYASVDWDGQTQRYGSESRQQLTIRNAAFRNDFLRRFYVQAGMMDSRDIFTSAGGNISFSQLPVPRIRGVRIGTTLAWINHDKVRHGTPVTLFLSRDSRIDAYRDGQLLGSVYLPPGAQALDTRTFPPGSYSLTLRIYEENQLVRVETVPFTSTGSAQDDTVQWFLQSGELDENTTTSPAQNDIAIQTGVRFPLIDTLSLTTGGALLHSDHFLETAADWVHSFSSGPADGLLTTRFSYLLGGDESRGNVQQISYNDGFSLSFYRALMATPHCDAGTYSAYRPTTGCYQNISLTLSWPVTQWFLNLGYTFNRNQGRYISRDRLTENDDGPPWEQIYTAASRSESWQLGASRYFTLQDTNLSTGLSIFTRHDTGLSGTDNGVLLSFRLSHSGRQRPSDRSGSASLGINWQGNQHQGNDFSYNASYSHLHDTSGENETGVSASGIGGNSATASLFTRSGGRYGTSTLTLSDAYSRRDNRHTAAASGSYASSLLLDPEGITWGRFGDGTSSSAVAVDVEKEEESEATVIDASLDSGGQASIPGGSRATFLVAGYRQSNLKIREPVGASMTAAGSEVSRGAGSKMLFMTPGRVYRHGVVVSSRYTWIGQLLDEHNQPLKDSIPLNVRSWSPVGNGAFALETANKLSALYVMRDNNVWHCRLVVKRVRDVVHYLGNTPCTPTTVAQLPEAEQQQAGLMNARLRNDGDSSVAKITSSDN